MTRKIYLNVTFYDREVVDYTDDYDTIMALDNRYSEIADKSERIFLCPCEVEIEDLVYIGDVVMVYRDRELFLLNTSLFNPDTDGEIMEEQGMATETITCAIEQSATGQLLDTIKDMEARRTYSCTDRFTQEVCSWIANDEGLVLEIDSEMKRFRLDIRKEGDAARLGSDFRIAVANALTNNTDGENTNPYARDLALSYLNECDMQEVLNTTRSILKTGGLD